MKKRKSKNVCVVVLVCSPGRGGVGRTYDGLGPVFRDQAARVVLLLHEEGIAADARVLVVVLAQRCGHIVVDLNGCLKGARAGMGRKEKGEKKIQN